MSVSASLALVITMVVERVVTWREIALRWRHKEGAQAQASAPNSDAPKENYFYALQSCSDQESSTEVVTGMLKLFSFNVYALLDPGAIL